MYKKQIGKKQGKNKTTTANKPVQKNTYAASGKPAVGTNHYGLSRLQ
jgi:hypothetical protein